MSYHIFDENGKSWLSKETLREAKEELRILELKEDRIFHIIKGGIKK